MFRSVVFFLTAITALTALASLAACKKDPPPPATIECNAAAISGDMERVESLTIYLDAGAPLDPVAADYAELLSKAWNTSVAVERGEPGAFSSPYVLWISTSSAARALAGPAPQGGYVLRRAAGANNTTVFVAHANETAILQNAAYALLEFLGIRFFHPRDTFVPALGAIHLPRGLDVSRTPYFATRGVQLHTLHPIEYLEAFTGTSDADFSEARELIDWLVKTGQNYVQWPIMETMDLQHWIAHATRIAEYAHGRGVSVSVNPVLFGSSALQNNFVLIKNSENWRAELEGQLDYLMQVPWDNVELSMGEFIAGDPERVIEWLDHTVAYVASKRASTTVSISNHVGNYDNLWQEFRGERTFFYHLPKFADPRLINSVHTVYFFDLFRDWGGYGHENFFLQREYLYAELPHRPMRYFPESAYWASADIDVPIFLPSYIYARWLDIHELAMGTARQGLPNIEGHVLFSSGHEWGYWMTDYLTAKMAWEPARSFESLLGEYSAAYGSCASTAQTALKQLIDLQNRYLFDARLSGYVSGEDLHDDLGLVAGFTTHPMRLAFEKLLEMSGAERATFEAETVVPLEAFAAELLPLREQMDAMCRGSSAEIARFCAELLDGTEIVRLRVQHSAELYRAVLTTLGGNGTDGRGYLEKAILTADHAAEVVARREPYYRYDAERLTSARENPTIYKFGYLRQPHTLCFWRRQEEQARHIMEKREPKSVLELPKCLD